MRLSKSNSFSLRKRAPDPAAGASLSPKRQNIVLRTNIAKTKTVGKALDSTFAFSTLKVDILDYSGRTKSTPKMRRTVTKLSPKHFPRETSEYQSVPRMRGGLRSHNAPSTTQQLPDPSRQSLSKSRSPKHQLVALASSPRHSRPPPKHAAHSRERELTDFEKAEIATVREVYYLGTVDLRGKSAESGFDDERGDYVLVPGDHLYYRYEVVDMLGKGSFGEVCRCVDHKAKCTVAVKIIRNKKRLYTQGLVEVKALQTLSEHDPRDTKSIVRVWSAFTFRGHLCIVFELLCYNLYELLKSRSYAGLPLPLVRRFAQQLLTALLFIAENDIIHCDLKPENVMLSRPNSADIKLIDFGSCCFSANQIYTYIQSRFYRAPEVVFGQRYSTQIDMWSLGCILAELSTGMPLFPGENESDLVLLMVEALGLPPVEVARSGCRSHLFFTEDGVCKMREDSKGVRRMPRGKPLGETLPQGGEGFLDFVEKCLAWEPAKRMTPKQGLAHVWVTSRDIS